MFKIFKLLVVYIVLCLPDLSHSNTDNLALLTGTLRTLQRSACDDEMVSLSCPRGTTISIQVAQYGKSPQYSRNCPNGRNGTDDVSPSRSSVEIIGEQQTCLLPNAMQYSLLQTVVETCQKKPQCTFRTQPKSDVDPCPGTRKFFDIKFKCRPYEFRSKTGCEHESVALSCNPGSRVAVLDAQYGRTKYEAGQCPQPPGVPEESCLTAHAAETVIQQCHGKRRCEMTANNGTFGNPCRSESRTYLKIVYTCVPLGVLAERYETPAEKDEIRVPSWTGTRQDDLGLFDDIDAAGERWSEPSVVPPAPAVVNPALQPPLLGATNPPQTTKDENTVYSTEKNEEHPKESTNIFIYIGVGVGLLLILIIATVLAKYFYVKRTDRQSKSPDVFTTDVPNVFNDGISDIDNDIDVSHISGTFYDPIHPDMILYRDANRGSLRAVRPMSTIYPCAGASMYGHVDYVPTENRKKKEDEDKDLVVSPKSLGRYSSSPFYYG